MGTMRAEDRRSGGKMVDHGVMQVAGFAGVPLDISDFPTRHNYGLALWQRQFQPILAGWVKELDVPILRGREVVGFTQDDGGVEVELSDGPSLRAAYLVGCEGGRSLVRRAAGIDFPGLEPSTSWMIAEVEMDEEPELGFRRDRVGQHALGRRQEGESVRVVLTERTVDHTGEPDLEELRAALIGVYGTDFGVLGDIQDEYGGVGGRHRRCAASELVPQGPGATGGGCRARASTPGRPGPEHRRAGRGEPGMEASPGRQGDVTGQPR